MVKWGSELMAPLIQVREVTKTFGVGAKRIEALRGVSFDIHEGEFITVIGASGAGKSTLLHILGTLDRPTQGRLFYEEEDIFSWNDRKLARFRNEKMGFVFQAHHLLPEFTALENTMMPALIHGKKRSAAAEQAASLLAQTGLSSRLHHKPGELSGGEQQRVALARALIMNPRIILADEPTGNLDSVTGKAIFDLLLQLNRVQNIAMVVVTHNEKLAARAQRCLILKDGLKIGDAQP
mgnify:FL=1